MTFRLTRYIVPEYAMQCSVARTYRTFRSPDSLGFHVPARAVDALAGKRLKDAGAMAGVADWYFLHRGQSLFLELKTEIGRQSPAQKEFQERVERAGGSYILARSDEEAARCLCERGIIPQALAL